MKRISPEMLAWVRKVDSLPMIVRDLNNRELWTPTPRSWLDLSNLIGAYSEGIFQCSYNDDDVLALLVSGEMNETVARYSEQAIVTLTPNRILEDGKYAEALMAAVEKTGGWPASNPIGNLTRLQPYLKQLGFKID